VCRTLQNALASAGEAGLLPSNPVIRWAGAKVSLLQHLAEKEATLRDEVASLSKEIADVGRGEDFEGESDDDNDGQQEEEGRGGASPVDVGEAPGCSADDGDNDDDGGRDDGGMTDDEGVAVRTGDDDDEREVEFIVVYDSDDGGQESSDGEDETARPGSGPARSVTLHKVSLVLSRC
jgi:hypothetical protein